MVLPETSAQQLLVDDGAVVGVRTGDKGRGSAGEELGNFEAGSDIVARVTVLAEGTQGHLTGVALDHFELRGSAAPQVWELAVKEVWKVRQPLDRVITTMGWPLRPAAKYREFGGGFVYPDGRRHGHPRNGGRPRLPRHQALAPRSVAGVEDPPQDPPNPGGGRATRMGSQDDPERGFPLVARTTLTRPDCCCAVTAWAW